MAYLCPTACWPRPLEGAATWKLLVSCVRQLLLTQLWTGGKGKEERGGEAGGGTRRGWSPGLPETGAASWTTSGCPSGLGLAPSVCYLLVQPGLPHPASRTPSLRAKVRAVHGYLLLKF